MPKRTLTIALSVLFASSAGVPMAAWGVLGHQLAATAAVQDLPPELAAWFAGQEGTMRDHANDPDRWKEHDHQEGPRHYLDCEPYGGAAQVPIDLGAARAQIGSDLFDKNGKVPWTIQEHVQLLAQTFASGDAGKVAFEASILSHYAADISVPLHTSSNHDGQNTGQRGVHRRWETSLLERIVDEESWTPEVRPAVLGPDSLTAPWAWLQEGFNLVPRVLADDLAAEQASSQDLRGSMGPTYWKVFQRLEEPVVKEQLTLAANRTAQMILLAWTQAGSPAAPSVLAARKAPGKP